MYGYLRATITRKGDGHRDSVGRQFPVSPGAERCFIQLGPPPSDESSHQMGNPLSASVPPPFTPSVAQGGDGKSSLGVLSIVFAFLVPIVGLVLGILAMNEGRN